MQKAAVVLLVATALVATAVEARFTFSRDELKSDPWGLYGRWAAYHEVVREPSRFGTFKANAEWRLSKQRHSDELVPLNMFGDRSFDELAAESCLKCATDPCPPDQEMEVKVIDFEQMAATRAAPATTLPSMVDWRANNPTAVTDVKRQGRCGSCWAFATAGAVEGAHAIKTTSAAVSLSPQFLLDCTSEYIDKSCGCSGGTRVRALNLIQKLGGIPSDSDYPYMGYQSQCDHHKFQWSATVSDWFRLQRFNATLLKLAVYLQPVPVNIGVDAKFYHWDPRYDGSVYYGPGNTTVSHGVLIVGYDVDDLGLPYWIVKNSWGTGWGDNGYIYINAEANNGRVGKMGVAGILSNPIFVEA